jgi:hypothetical protein
MNMILPFLFITLIISFWLYPSITPVMGIFLLLTTIAMSVWTIFKKHKRTENSRSKIIKDVSILVATILLITILGGLTGMFTNYYASLRFGAVWGVVSSLAASFAVGYLVRWGVGQVSR